MELCKIKDNFLTKRSFQVVLKCTKCNRLFKSKKFQKKLKKWVNSE